MRPAFLSTPLRHFLAVAQLGSVSAAAEQLHVAASAISRQVSKLESTLGLALFERRHRGLTLTPAGLELAARLRSASEEVDRVMEQVQGIVQQREQQLRLACTEGFAPGFVPAVMNRFSQVHPQVRIQLMVAPPREVARLLLHGQADLGLKYSVAPERGLQVHLSALAPAQAVMLPGHPLARQASLRMADVVRYPLLLPTPGNTGRDLFDLSCSLQGLQYQARVESNFASTLFSMLMGQDLLLAGSLTVMHLLDQQALVAVAFAEGEMQQRRLQLLSAEGVAPSAAVQAFIAQVKLAAQSHSP